MNRATLASLAVAAVVGTSGGIALAVNNGDKDESPTTSSSPTPPETSESTGGTPDPSDTTPPEPTALYYADGAIHDGDASVAVPDSIDAGLLLSLARVDGGWLLVQSGDENPINTATFVATDGDSWRIGGTQGHWDLNPDRTRFYYDTGSAWKVAEFSKRSAQVIDILDGVGRDLDFMTLTNRVPGISYGSAGLITAWQDGGSVRLVSTEIDTSAHSLLEIEDISLPDSNADGSVLVSSFDNPDYSPTSPVGSCATGGATDVASPTKWWQICERGPVTTEPFSADGRQLLLGETVGDGPPGSSLVVVDPMSGDVLDEFDPGGYFLGAAWSDVPGVVLTLTADDESGLQQLSACTVATGACEDLVTLDGSVRLGTVS